MINGEDGEKWYGLVDGVKQIHQQMAQSLLEFKYGIFYYIR